MRGISASQIKGGQMWDDLRAPANAINPAGVVSPATVSTVDGCLIFAKGQACVAWFQLPHAWKVGSDISPHIHWCKTTSASGAVNWRIKYKWFNIGTVDPGLSALTAGSVGISDANTANSHALYEFPDLSGAGKTISSMVCVYLERVNDGNDTYAADVNLYEIDIHYQIDSLGSDLEYTKY